MPDCIDIDTPDLWPRRVEIEVSAVVAAHDEWQEVEYADELHLNEDERASIEGTCAPYSLHCYHATRLTQEEVQSVLAEGLIPLSVTSVRNRFAQAEEQGHLPAPLSQKLLPGALELASAANRANQVCLTTSRLSLRSCSSFRYLLAYWGGEAVTMQLKRGDPALEQLQMIGLPAVVAAAIPMKTIDSNGRYLDVPRDLVASRLGLSPRGSVYLDRVEAGAVIQVVVEGSAEWRVLAQLSEW